MRWFSGKWVFGKQLHSLQQLGIVFGIEIDVVKNKNKRLAFSGCV